MHCVIAVRLGPRSAPAALTGRPQRDQSHAFDAVRHTDMSICKSMEKTTT